MLEDWQKLAAREIEIPLQDVPAGQRISGAPRTGSVQIEKFGGTVVGVWEMTPGVMRCGQNTNPSALTSCGDAVAKSTFKDGKWQAAPPITDPEVKFSGS